MQVDVADQVAAGQEGENVADLLGEVRRLGPRLLQDRGLRGQTRRGEQRQEVERRRDEQPVHHPSRLRLEHRWRGQRLRLSLPGPPQAQVDPARVEGVERPKLLDHRDRGLVAELDGPGADPDPAGRRGHETDEHRGRRAGHAGREVMLGQPVPPVAGLLGLLRQVDRVTQRLRRGAAGQYWRQVQNGQRS
ncbi:hypothetical protein Prum_012890 [Phytohabitans rumicis]|uniref:Uncharacterized protein n=1 Tax=Phytohabitans rumicis TaxID=1076125 RepID=A0A6V8L0M3_9ACTN|nr:hypothetical protein Prum_012890 [Phytohabitans rumicis]